MYFGSELLQRHGEWHQIHALIQNFFFQGGGGVERIIVFARGVRVIFAIILL